MHAFERRGGIQRLVLGEPEKGRTLNDKKRPEPFTSSKRRMTKGGEETGRNLGIRFRLLNF